MKDAPALRSFFRAGRVLRIVRRVHMYLGLLMCPWVLFFGLSGMLFNHPQIGRDGVGERLAAERLQRLTDIQPWDAAAIAERVVTRVNQQTPGYRLDEAHAPSFHGWPLLATQAKNGDKHVLILNLEQGAGIHARHPARRTEPAAPFASEIEVNASMQLIEAQVSGLSKGLALDVVGPFKRHPKVAPEVRFRLRDPSGVLWNASYDMGAERLTGRPSDAPSPLFFVELLERLHKQHHFPINGGPELFWALVADLTGFTLILWALSGIAMWWQMKATRFFGVLALSAALLIALGVLVPMAEDIEWNATVTSGPG